LPENRAFGCKALKNRDSREIGRHVAFLRHPSSGSAAPNACSRGFDELGRLTGKAPQSLMRMLSRTGNSQAHNLFEVIRVLQEHEGVQTEVRFKRCRPAVARGR
jgi:hypothetical protein